MKYYVARNGQPEGPFTLEELAQQGIRPDTLVYNESMPNWTPAGNVPEIQASVLGGAQPAQNVPNGGYAPCAGQPYQQQAPYQQSYQQPYQQPFQQQAQMGPSPKTWLVESILVTLFCCLPFGIIGIIYSAGVSSAYNSGNYQEAVRKSAKAGTWTKVGFFCGLIGSLLYLVFFVLMGMGGMMMQ